MHAAGPLTQLCPEGLCARADDRGASERLPGMLSDLGVVYLHLVLSDDLRALLPSIGHRWRGFGRGQRGGGDAAGQAAARDDTGAREPGRALGEGERLHRAHPAHGTAVTALPAPAAAALPVHVPAVGDALRRERRDAGHVGGQAGDQAAGAGRLERRAELPAPPAPGRGGRPVARRAAGASERRGALRPVAAGADRGPRGELPGGGSRPLRDADDVPGRPARSAVHQGAVPAARAGSTTGRPRRSTSCRAWRTSSRPGCRGRWTGDPSSSRRRGSASGPPGSTGSRTRSP